MNHTSLIFILFSSLAGILAFAIWSNAYVYAQQTSSPARPSVSSTASRSAQEPGQQYVAKIKITSPTRGQQVPIGKDLTISGTSISNATSNNDCKVSVIANKVRPYQPATATGTGGAADYSKWKFDITPKYTMIKPGQNRITAKYECGNNAALTSFSSVNVIGVPSLTPLQNPKPIATTIPTVSNASNKPSSSVIAPQLNTINQQEHPPQLLPTTQVQNYTLSPTYSGMGSDKLMYLGYHHGNDSFTGKSGSSITTTKSDNSSNNHDNNGDSSSKITGNSNTESSNHNTGGGATHVRSTGKTGTIKSEISSSHDSDSTITHDSSAGKNTTTTTTTVGSLTHSSPNDKKNSSDTKSSAHKNDGSKTHSSTSPHSSQSNNHKNNDNKAMKSSTSSPKGSDHHKSGGDSFFGGDPFFNDDDDF
jgi:hypothetical protein